ncbi:hypothetical protein V6N13_058103 [Hibiscus sabdariffa]|uniref:Secreted protein n=1 Tax=Hibiscus sabdariffa TaxID=183260 RepID=A0ABR2GH71_9ROSI
MLHSRLVSSRLPAALALSSVTRAIHRLRQRSWVIEFIWEADMVADRIAKMSKPALSRTNIIDSSPSFLEDMLLTETFSDLLMVKLSLISSTA